MPLDENSYYYHTCAGCGNYIYSRVSNNEIRRGEVTVAQADGWIVYCGYHSPNDIPDDPDVFMIHHMPPVNYIFAPGDVPRELPWPTVGTQPTHNCHCNGCRT